MIEHMATREYVVTEEMTAQAVRSGSLRVLATPVIAAWMEEASTEAIRSLLPEGITTVGTRLELDHVSPTPVGARVRVESRLVKTEGRKYTFEVTAEDENGVCAKGTHIRYAVKIEPFLKKAYGTKEETV